MKGTRTRKKIADLRRQPIRQSSGTPDDLKALARSWLERPAHDIIVTPGLTVADGHRRLDGLVLLGETEADVLVLDEELDEKGLLQLGLTTAIHRADLTGFEKWQACAELMCMNPGWQLKDLAEHLHLDPSSVTRLLSPSKCTPEWQEALKQGKVGISDCYAASKLSHEKQAGLLALKLSGASRDQLEEAGRKTRRTAATVKLSRVVCAVSAGVKIVIAGPEMDLDALIENLESVLSAARKANKESLDVRTFEKVLKDKAKVAG